MKILVATANIDPKSGGPTRSVKGLCRALSCQGQDVTLFVANGEDSFENPCGVKVEYGNDIDVGSFDLVHINGLWTPGLHRIAIKCRADNINYLISPRGMLDPWALSVKKWKKRLGMLLYQKKDIKLAKAFHATAQAEVDHIRAAGFSQPCIVAPNGVDWPEEMPVDSKTGDEKIALFLSRLHPGKGLLSLARAWAKVKPKGWRMRVVGPDTYNHKKDVVKLLETLGIRAQWEFRDEVCDSSKWVEYRQANLLVHPSVSENFGITIAEALVSGLPVIATKGAPWKSLEEFKCGWWIDIGVPPLVDALHAAVTMEDDALRKMGMCGAKFARNEFGWREIAKRMIGGYSMIASKGSL